MKKMIFSAIAIVAISSVSMANTVEVKEVKTETREVVKADDSLLQTTPCDTFWKAAYSLYISNNAGSAGSDAAYGYADALSTVVGC
jgi:hypothetical protein